MQFQCGKPTSLTALNQPSAWFNTCNLNDYSQPRSVNMFKQARAWEDDAGAYTAAQLVSGGYVTKGGKINSLPSGVTTLKSYLMIGAQPAYVTLSSLSYLSDRYTFKCSGSATLDAAGTGVSIVSSVAGQLVFDFDATASNAYCVLKVTPTNPVDLPRGFTCIGAKMASASAAGLIWRPDLWTQMAGAAGHRMMKLSNTDGDNSAILHWSDRPQFSDEYWSGGMPLEAQIAYGNESGKHVWFCCPYAVDDNYMLQMATLIRDTLNPALISFAEFSNEDWNFGYGYVTDIYNRGNALWGVAGGNENEWHAMRSTQMMVIFSGVFAGQMKRLRRVMGTQAGNVGVTNRVLAAAKWQAASPGAWVDPKSVHDYLGTTGYFGHSVLSTNASAIATALGTSQAAAVNAILNTYAPAAAAAIKTNLASDIALAKAAGLKTCLYENSQHMNLSQAAGTALYSGSNPIAGAVDMMEAVYQDARCEAIKDDIFKSFKLAGGTFECIFGDFGWTAAGGGWYTWRYIGDTTTQGTAYAARSAANPRWFHY